MMRSLLLMAMLTATLGHAAWNGYTETRELAVSAEGVKLLEIDAGAGALVVFGVADTTEIKVTAVIRVDEDDDDARELIASDLELKLETRRSKALLESSFGGNFRGHRDAVIDLEVAVPHGLSVFVDDGSGPIRIDNIVGDLEIDDGSGLIEIVGVTGTVKIDDGSGDISVRDVGGSVVIDDGSGGININNVERDVEIDGSGSGGVRIADVRGTVRQKD